MNARARKWVLRALIVTLAVSVITLAGAWFALRASLPLLDGSIDVAGLSGEAVIARDAMGIPVITAATRDDLAFATGFAHGQDRYFQMDLVRRQAAGELSALFGPVALDTDRRFRFHRFRARAREVLATLAPEERRLLERYAAGANAGVDSLAVRPFEYLVLGQVPAPWTAEDTLLVVYAMYVQLNDELARGDVRRGYANRVLPPAVYGWLYPDGSPWDVPLMGEARPVGPAPAPDTYAVHDRPAVTAFHGAGDEPLMPGSNNWAVGGALTEDGRAMVANDMHLGHSVPNIYYRARLVQTGAPVRDVTGVTLPGTPFVVAGSNGRVAWGYTNSNGDWSDAVVVVPGAEPGTYRTADGDRPFTEYRERIEVEGGEPVEFVVRETEWGPVDESAGYPDGEIAVSWIAHHARGVNLRILDLETVTTADEALDVANTLGMPPQNFVTGDDAGNIGWTIAGQIPVRGDYDATVPSDWSEGAGWSGWRRPDEVPRVYNPPHGRIWTANARVADGDALAVLGDGGYDLAARAKQIRDGLFALDRFTPGDMLALQNDDRALFLAPWRDLLLSVLDDDAVAGDALLAEYRQLVTDWTPRADRGSAGYRFVRGFRQEVRRRVFDGLMAPVHAAYETPVDLLVSNQFEGPLWQLVTTRPTHLLPAGADSWESLLVDAARTNANWFATNFDTPLADRTWGERNTASIRHPLSRAVPALSGLLDMPREPLAGDSHMPRAQGPDFGASERFSVSPGDEASALMQMPTGQSGHPLSRFYRAGHENWVHGRPQPFLPGTAAYTLKLAPSGGTLHGS